MPSYISQLSISLLHVCSIPVEYFSMPGVNFFVVHSKASSLCKLNLDNNRACWILDRCFVFFFVSEMCHSKAVFVSYFSIAVDCFPSLFALGPFQSASGLSHRLCYRPCFRFLLLHTTPHEDTNSFSTFVVDLGSGSCPALVL